MQTTSNLQAEGLVFESDGFVVRRSELDDCEKLGPLLSSSKTQDFSLNLLYNYPNLVSLLEKAFLAVTVLDNNSEIAGLAVFNDFPQGINGMIDFQHINVVVAITVGGEGDIASIGRP